MTTTDNKDETNQVTYAKQLYGSKFCLSTSNIQKIIQQFISEKKATKLTLANTLDITTKEVELLLMKKGSLKLISKINLPLIKLYCSTKFEKNS